MFFNKNMLRIVIPLIISLSSSIALGAVIIDQKVPFSSQAPLLNWSDPRQQDACEEVSALMAIDWAKNREERSKLKWQEEIIKLADFQEEKYFEHRDTSVEDVVARIFKDYFSYDKVRIEKVIDPDSIILELEAGNLVIVPTNGQALNNPNFSAPGPKRHMLVIKGYDYNTEEFITNDPGTKNGANYRYEKNLLFEAIRNYKTGYHEDFD